MPLHPFAGEIVLATERANIFRGIEGVGGVIIITNFRIRFEPHMLSIQGDPEEIPLHVITEIGKRNTWGFIPNGMYIRTSIGPERNFITWKREKIIALVISQQPHLQR